MSAYRQEGSVLVTLLALSAVMMMIIVGLCWMIGIRHMKMNGRDMVCAEDQIVGIGEAQGEAAIKKLLSLG